MISQLNNHKCSTRTYLSAKTGLYHKMPAPERSAFVHDPLNLGRDIIRVLRIRPGESSAQIECTVQHVPLRNTHVCLSYMWGDDNHDLPIFLDGKIFKVRYNLWQFMWRARLNNIQDELWIDAICISPDRASTKCCRNLRINPLFCEGVGFLHLGPDWSLKGVQLL